MPDLARLFRQEPQDIGFRQGVVTAWDPLTRTSSIDVGGSTLDDVPLLVTSSVTIVLGDVVGLLRVRSQYFVLGKIVPAHGVDAVAIPGVYGLGLGAIEQWPQTASTDEVSLIVADVLPHGTHFSWTAWTSVQSGATARYRAYVNGILVGDSGTYQAGSGTFSGDADWPDGTRFGAVFDLRAQVLSGAAGVKAAATLIRLYEE